MDESSQRPVPFQASAIPRCLSSQRKLLLWLAGYFALQCLLRLVTSRTADLDESEQLLTTQHLQWGYGPQPPLYTWLQYPFVRLFGPGILALALFKNLLLFGIYAVTYRNARFVLRDHAHAVVATLSLLFIPQLAWESQRDLTHSVLVTFIAVATFHCFVKLHERRALRWYGALGVCIGFGLLSKYSFGVFLAGIAVGAMTLASLRSVVLNARMAGAVIVGAAIFAPHLIWAVNHADWATANSRKLGIATSEPWLSSTISGLGHMMSGLGTHLGALLGIYLLTCWAWARRRRSGRERHAEVVLGPAEKPGRTNGLSVTASLILRTLLVMLGLLLAGILFFRVTGFKDRWFLPLCVWVPILLVALCADRLGLAKIRALVTLAGVVGLVIAILVPARIWCARSLGKSQLLNAPFARLAGDIQKSHPAPDFLIVGDNWVGGNLKQFFPGALVLNPRRLLLTIEPAPGSRGYVVWGERRSDLPESAMLESASRVASVDTNAVQYFEAPLQFWPENDKPMRLGLAPCQF